MVQFGKSFDSDKVEPSQAFELVPEGWYKAQIVKSDYKPTKNQDGHYLAFQFVIIDGDYTKRMVFTNINIDNKNQTAVEIAERNFSALCKACGVVVCEDTEQLHGRPIEIKVGITPAQGQYETRNDIKGYRPIENIPAFDKEENETVKDARENTDELPGWLND